MHFDTLAKHSPVNSKKCAAVLFLLIKEFENRFQDCWKKILIFWSICNSIFSQHKYITCEFSDGMYRAAIRYSTQRFHHVSLPAFYNLYLIGGEYLLFTPHSCHCLLAACTFVSSRWG